MCASHLHFVPALCLHAWSATLRLRTLSLRVVEGEGEGGWVVYRHRASESSRYSHGMRVAVASEYRLQPEVKEGLQARKQTFFLTNRAMRTGLKPLHNFRLKAVLRPRGKRFLFADNRTS